MFSEDNVLTCGQGKAGNNSLARCSGLVRHHRPQGYVLPGVVLCPNPAFLPKVLTEFHLTRQLSYDHSPPLKETRRVSSSCCARSGPWQSTSGAHRPSGRLISCSSASNQVIWADPCPSLDFPTGLWTQSSRSLCFRACLSRTGFGPTCGMASSWALWWGASIRAAATWSSQSTFSRFYCLNIAASPSFGE